MYDSAMSVQQTLQNAVAHHRAGKLAEAESLYRQVLRTDPKNADALRLLGLISAARGNAPEAEQLIRQALKIAPRSADAWNDLAGVYAQTAKTEPALEAFRKAIDANPNHAGARNNLGDLLNQLGRSEEAFKCWEETIRINPNIPEPHYNIGRHFFAQGKLEAAAQCYHRALKARPDYAPAYNNLGVVHWTAGRRDEAAAAFATAVRINPGYVEAWNNLGSVYDEVRQLDKAIECWKRAIALRPDYADAHKNLGVALEKKGDRAAAIHHWEQALRLRPKWDEPQYYLAAARGEKTLDKAPPQYVVKLFDEYADKFDEHLLSTLEYRVPELLLEAIRRSGRARFDVVMDLGCGTGLCGERFRSISGRLSGVDLSPRMIEKARARGIYDELIVGGLEEALAGRSDMDLILAGDVLGYVGELGALFKSIASGLRHGGYFAFSVEKPSEEETGDLVLRKSRRFAHSRRYVEQTASAAGLQAMELSEAMLRMDEKMPIMGMICLLRKP